MSPTHTKKSKDNNSIEAKEGRKNGVNKTDPREENR